MRPLPLSSALRETSEKSWTDPYRQGKNQATGVPFGAGLG